MAMKGIARTVFMTMSINQHLKMMGHSDAEAIHTRPHSVTPSPTRGCAPVVQDMSTDARAAIKSDDGA